jgi:hypothetical protein
VLESNGEEVPKSKTNPVSFEVLLNVIVVPAFTQNGALDLALGILGVAEAESPPSRLMSTSHADAAEPHVFAALQMLAGVDAEHTSFLGFFFSFPSRNPVISTGTVRRQKRTGKNRLALIGHLTLDLSENLNREPREA